MCSAGAVAEWYISGAGSRQHVNDGICTEAEDS